jgi:thioredoxin-like negative regulator of GroEL
MGGPVAILFRCHFTLLSEELSVFMDGSRVIIENIVNQSSDTDPVVVIGVQSSHEKVKLKPVIEHVNGRSAVTCG